ncbi:MAG: tetratricopeptide repeat protein, partial [Candidatus Muiribacteriota bacterium]
MRKTTKLLIFFVFILLCFNQILADDFDNTIKQGILYFNSGDFTRAVDFFKKAVLMKNDDLNARYNLAVTYFKLREYSKSLEETMDILKIFPTDEPTLKLLSQIRTQTVEELKIRIDEYPFEEKWYV